MAKSAKVSPSKRLSAKSSKASKQVKKASPIKKDKKSVSKGSRSSGKASSTPATPALKKGSKQKWAAPYKKEILMYKTQPDYFAMVQKYSHE